MSFIKTFDSFKNLKDSRIFIANPLADNKISESEILESLTEADGFYSGDVEKVTTFLESEGFSSPVDFIVVDSLNEALNVKYVGHEAGKDGVEIFITINGHKYGYKQKEGDLEIGEIARKFEKMLQFSAGRALTWLKKHTALSSGSASTEKSDTKDLKEGKEETEHTEPESHMDNTDDMKSGAELDHYMFFGNLKTIKKHIDMMMEMDPAMVDELIKNGHDWAADHIATSKDDIEEVCNWLSNEIKK
jgi:hypothetical protein